MKRKKIVGVLVLAFVLWFVIDKPEQAAATAERGGSAVKSGAENVSTFMANLTDGR